MNGFDGELSNRFFSSLQNGNLNDKLERFFKSAKKEARSEEIYVYLVLGRDFFPERTSMDVERDRSRSLYPWPKEKHSPLVRPPSHEGSPISPR